MKKDYGLARKILFVLFISILPFLLFGQESDDQSADKKPDSFTPHLYVNLNGGLYLAHTDVNQYTYWVPSDSWRFGYGVRIGWQFLPFLNLRGEVTNGQLHGSKKNMYGWDVYFEATPGIGWHLQPVFNLSNLFAGYRERLIDINFLVGVGGFSFKSELKNQENNEKLMQYKTQDGSYNFEPADQKSIDDMEEIHHVWSWPVGLGVDIRLHERWDLTFEGQVRFLDWEHLDRVYVPQDKPFKRDVMSYWSVGITYKFAYKQGLKKMDKNYDMVTFTATPEPLEVHGDSIEVTIKSDVLPKYFDKKSAMLVRPFLKYEETSYPLETITLKGEDVPGDGVVINYKDGGSYSYTTKIPYEPGMNVSELMVTPIVYPAKEGTYADEASITENAKFIILPERKIDDGVIATSRKVMDDEFVLYGPHSYEKETIITEKAKIYFLVNRYNLNWRVPLNKNEEFKKKLNRLPEFIALGWEIKNIDIKGWASPEGEETFNRDLSENRANTSFNYMVKEIKKVARTKDSKVDIKDPKKEVQFDVTWHGPDWDNFLKSVEKSNITDKSAIINVIKSSGQAKKEEEIKNMITIYPEIEENLLPQLRRAAIFVNCYEPKRTDVEIMEISITYPDSLKVEELLYAATLYEDNETKIKIYESVVIAYPNNGVGHHNAGAVSIEMGEYEAASGHLTNANNLLPNNGKVINNLGVLECQLGNYKKAEIYFRKAKNLGEDVNYNIGVLEILDGNYDEALRLFGKTKCKYNVALAQLLNGDNAGAEKNLNCAPKTAEVYYLLAIIGSRTNNTKMLYENLIKAIELDPEYKSIAGMDREFIGYYTSPDFKNIVQ